MLDRVRLGSARGAVAFVAALEAGLSGESAEVVEGYLAELLRFGVDTVRPDGIPSADAGALFVRAAFIHGDASVPVRAAEALLADWSDHEYLAGVARMALGYAAYLRGDDSGALAALASLGERVDRSRPVMTIIAAAVRGLAAMRSGAGETGRSVARSAYHAAGALGVREAPALAVVHEAYAVALASAGDVAGRDRRRRSCRPARAHDPALVPRRHPALAGRHPDPGRRPRRRRCEHR